MPSTLWTKLVEPRRSALPGPMDPTVKTFINELCDDDGPDLCDHQAREAQTAKLRDIQNRFLDEEDGEKLESLFVAARFCRAHSRFEEKSVPSATVLESDGFATLHAHRISNRMAYVRDHTSKVALDSVDVGRSLTAPSERNPSVYLSHLMENVRARSVDDIPKKDINSRKFNLKKTNIVDSLRTSIAEICDEMEAYYRNKHKKELGELALAEAAWHAQWK
jgi:hypothetical protein